MWQTHNSLLPVLCWRGKKTKTSPFRLLYGGMIMWPSLTTERSGWHCGYGFCGSFSEGRQVWLTCPFHLCALSPAWKVTGAPTWSGRVWRMEEQEAKRLGCSGLVLSLTRENSYLFKPFSARAFVVFSQNTSLIWGSFSSEIIPTSVLLGLVEVKNNNNIVFFKVPIYIRNFQTVAWILENSG